MLEEASASLPDRAADGLLIAACIFAVLAFGAVESWSRSIVALLLVAATALRVVSPHRLRFGVEAKLLMSVLGLIICMGLLQALNPRSPLSPFPLLPATSSSYGSVQSLASWAGFTVAVGCSAAIHVRGRSLYLLGWLLALGAVVASLGIIQKVTGNHLMYGFRIIPYGYDAFGPFYNKDHAATFLGISGMAGVGLFGWNVARFQSGKSRMSAADYIAKQVLLGFAVVLVSAGLMYTGSRAGLAGFLAALMLFGGLLIVRRRVSVGAAAAAGLLFAGGIVASAYLAPGLYHLARIPYSIAFRLELYRSALALSRDFPLFGVGSGSFMSVFPPYQALSVQGTVTHAHNDWLEWACELGLPLACVWASVVGLIIARAYQKMKNARPEDFWLVGAALSAVIFSCLHALVEYPMNIPANALIFAVLLGLLADIAGPGAAIKPVSARSDLAARAAFLALSTIVLVGGVREGVGGYYARMAARADSGASTPLWKSAIDWDPKPQYLYKCSIGSLTAADAAPNAMRADGMLREALVMSQRALEAAPYEPAYRRLVGTLLLRLGRRPDAQTYL